MDTSPKYIKMCKKAIEMQKQWEPDVADFVMGEYESTITIWQTVQGISHGSLKPLFTNAGKLAWYLKSEMIWLPRQDQLQEIVGGHPTSFLSKLGKFMYREHDASNPNNLEIWNKFNSMEQLWLAFVMKKKYNKEWKGNDWETIK